MKRLTKKERLKIKMVKRDKEIIVGTLLGDSCLRYVHSGCTSPQLTFSHAEKNKVYFKWKYNLLSKFFNGYIKRNKKSRFKELNFVYQTLGKNLPCLINFRKKFYLTGKKVIPFDLLEKYFTAKSLAILFMDDGCINLKTINLNLQNFKEDELKNFVVFIKNRFNIEFILKKDKTLYLRYNSVNTFLKLVSKHITKDMQYKLPSYH